MSSDPHACRFVPRWLLPATETDGEQASEAPDASFFSLDDRSTNNLTGQEFDEALEQISSEGCCVCPLCGAIVFSDGSVVSYRHSGKYCTLWVTDLRGIVAILGA